MSFESIRQKTSKLETVDSLIEQLDKKQLSKAFDWLRQIQLLGKKSTLNLINSETAGQQKLLRPNAQTVNNLRSECFLYEFLDDTPDGSNDTIAETAMYYEEVIYKTKCIPTRRDSWHDFFNAMIWLQFPLTKQLLNEIHIQQIQLNGLVPRGAIRDRVTHFDECGIVLLCDEPDEIQQLLSEHSWHQLFVEKRQDWSKSIQPIIFGHAIYEMLLTPHIGLTAKAVVLDNSDGMRLSQCKTAKDLVKLDEQLRVKLQSADIFIQKRQLKPLPVLGIPGWHLAQQNDTFYNDTSYFMPKRQ